MSCNRSCNHFFKDLVSNSQRQIQSVVSDHVSLVMFYAETTVATTSATTGTVGTTTAATTAGTTGKVPGLLL